MSDFKAKMHKIRFRHPAGGAYSAPTDPLAAFKGPTSNGREMERVMGGEGGGNGKEKRRGNRGKGTGPAP